ncbi:hypothetical protein SAMN05216311_10645 [Chitinophaga sp. CF418]|nr:hypothetical protein SAMN05216311_10645 [Chitinophaga sp. CF418]
MLFDKTSQAPSAYRIAIAFRDPAVNITLKRTPPTLGPIYSIIIVYSYCLSVRFRTSPVFTYITSKKVR